MKYKLEEYNLILWKELPHRWYIFNLADDGEIPRKAAVNAYSLQRFGKKAYDTASREEVSLGLRQRGFPERYVRLLQETYRNASTRIGRAVGDAGIRCAIEITTCF